MKLTLKSCVTKKTWDYDVEDAGDVRLFYHFPEFQLTEIMDEGEYEYELFEKVDEEYVLVAQGLLQIGDYEDNNIKTYTTDGNGYKQYRPE